LLNTNIVQLYNSRNVHIPNIYVAFTNFLLVLTELVICQQTSVMPTNIKFRKIPFGCSWVVNAMESEKHITKLIS